jgi:lipoprotein Spr
MRGEAIVARARALVGVRFRPQGRSAGLGLDCIGLAAMATERPLAGVPRDYRLRSSDAATLEAGLRSAGLVPVAPDEAAGGDLLVVQAGPAQLHVIVLTGAGFVHADAGLRRVVEVPGAVPWPALSGWRVPSRETE